MWDVSMSVRSRWNSIGVWTQRSRLFRSFLTITQRSVVSKFLNSDSLLVLYMRHACQISSWKFHLFTSIQMHSIFICSVILRSWFLHLNLQSLIKRHNSLDHNLWIIPNRIFCHTMYYQYVINLFILKTFQVLLNKALISLTWHFIVSKLLSFWSAVHLQL